MKAMIERFAPARQEPEAGRGSKDHDAALGIVNAVLISVFLWSAIIAAAIALFS